MEGRSAYIALAETFAREGDIYHLREAVEELDRQREDPEVLAGLFEIAR